MGTVGHCTRVVQCLGGAAHCDAGANGNIPRQAGAAVVDLGGRQGDGLPGDGDAGISRRGAAGQVVVAGLAAGERQASDRDAIRANILGTEGGECAAGVHVGAVARHHAGEHRALHAAGVGGAVVHLVGDVERGDRYILFGQRHRRIGRIQRGQLIVAGGAGATHQRECRNIVGGVVGHIFAEGRGAAVGQRLAANAGADGDGAGTQRGVAVVSFGGRKRDRFLVDGQRAVDVAERIIARGVALRRDEIATGIGRALRGTRIGERTTQRGVVLTQHKAAIAHPVAAGVGRTVIGLAGVGGCYCQRRLVHRQRAGAVADGVVGRIEAARAGGGAGGDGVARHRVDIRRAARSGEG